MNMIPRKAILLSKSVNYEIKDD